MLEVAKRHKSFTEITDSKFPLESFDDIKICVSLKIRKKYFYVKIKFVTHQKFIEMQ